MFRSYLVATTATFISTFTVSSMVKQTLKRTWQGPPPTWIFLHWMELERINCGTLEVVCVFDGSATNSDAGSAALLYIVDGTKWDFSYPDVCAATVRVRLCHCTAIMAEMVAFLLGHALATMVYQKWAGRVASGETFLRDLCRNADVSMDAATIYPQVIDLVERL